MDTSLYYLWLNIYMVEVKAFLRRLQNCSHPPLPKTSTTPGDKNTFEAHPVAAWNVSSVVGLDLKRHRTNVSWRPFRWGYCSFNSLFAEGRWGEVGDDPSCCINQKVIECIHNNVVPSNYCATTCTIIILTLWTRIAYIYARMYPYFSADCIYICQRSSRSLNRLFIFIA